MNGTRGADSRDLADDDDMPDRLAELEGRLEQLEADAGFKARGRRMVGRVMPSDATRHFRNAGRENLLGVRAMVDFWLRRLDEADERASVREHHAETIELD
jgi:hypothetical protein